MSKYTKFTIEYLLDLLLHNGLLSEGQAIAIKVDYIESIGERAKSRGPVSGKKSPSSSDPLDYIISLKLPFIGANSANTGRIVGDDILARLMAIEASLPYRYVELRELDLELVTSILPQSFAARHLVLPLGVAEKHLEVAVRHPFYQSILEDVHRVANYTIRPVIVPESNLKKLIHEIYAFQGSVAGAENMYTGGPTLDLGNLEQFVKLKSTSEIAEDDQHIKNLINFLLAEGLHNKA
ncbi:MAG: hypothetical protein ACRCTY_06055, partial [Candidatus Adiutrix sp.]